MKVTINVNEVIYFRPTLAALNRYFAKYNSQLSINEDGYVSMTLWSFMETFGDMYVVGTRQIPSIGNDLEFRQ